MIDLSRPDLVDAVLQRARGGAPMVLSGPPGAGKTMLLHEVALALESAGWIAVYLDLMGAASCPGRFVIAALDALPAQDFGPRLQEATAIRRLTESGRAQESAAVQALFSLWGSLDEAGGRPVALLLDEPTEIRSLAYFAGLREVEKPMRAALGTRRGATVLATSFPTHAQRLFPGLETIALPPLTADSLAPALAGAGIAVDAEALALAAFGWPRYVPPLLERLAAGGDLTAAWTAEMAPGGRIETLCRHTYECLLLRSRGYGMSKAVLGAVAEEEGLNLTALVARLGRTPGAVRDYLGWLLGVDALKMIRKRYYYVDGMVRGWVRLHGRGARVTKAELQAAARELIDTPRASAPAAMEPAAIAVRRDPLMEID